MIAWDHLTDAASELFFNDMLPLLDYIIEDLLESCQVIVVPNHGKFTNKGRVLVFFRLLIPDLSFEFSHPFLLDVLHVDLQSLAGLREPRRVWLEFEAADLAYLRERVQEVVDPQSILSR